MKPVSFTKFMSSTIASMEANGRWSTARVYAAALRSVTEFIGGGELFFGALTPQFLKRFEAYLRDKQRKWNTVSTYLRMLRATYNRGVDEKLTAPISRLFKTVYTGVKREQKQALTPNQMHRLIYAPACQPLTAEQEESRQWVRMMFELQGMPFVDLANLRHSDLHAEKRLLTCHRRKTGTPLEITLSADMMKWIERHRNTNREASPYLFNILRKGMDSAEGYREYQQLLSNLNYNIQNVATIQGVNVHVSSYIARHTWATLAKYCKIPEGMISDALGHTSVKTTQIYLKSFEGSTLKRANSKVVRLVQGAVTL